MTTTVTGIVHVHSRFSYDGVHSLTEIAAFARRRGYRFVAMSEHSETLDARAMAAHVEECERVSTDGTTVIPGVEFSVGGIHLLGLGVRRPIEVRDACDVARSVREQGGVVVIAHPARYGYAVADRVAEAVDGIEVWNGGYDGRFVPDHRLLRLWRTLRERTGSLLGFGGPDLHRIGSQEPVRLTIQCDGSSANDVLAVLRAGRFTIGNRWFSFDARHVPHWAAVAEIAAARGVYELARGVRDVMARGR